MTDEAIDPLTYYKTALQGYDLENRNLKAALEQSERMCAVYKRQIETIETRLTYIKSTNYRLRSSLIRNLLTEIKQK